MSLPQQKSSPFDLHTSLYRDSFSKGLPYHEFIQTGSEAHRSRWNSYLERYSLDAEQIQIAATFKREMNVLVLAGMWCGDCARQCPMLQKIAESAPAFKLRFIDNNTIPELRDHLRIHGASRVPVALFLSEDFFEIGRFGDRTLAAYRRKATQELGDACDAGIVPPAPEELQAELQEWFGQFERLQLMLRVSPMLRSRHSD